MLRNKKILIFLIFIFILQSCSSKQGFSTDKEIINPLTIYSYPNLALPPIYYISSKEIMDRRKYFLNKQKDINNSISIGMFGSNIENNNLAPSDIQFLKAASSYNNYTFIRDTLNQESLYLIKKNDNFIKKIFSNDKGEALENGVTQYKNINQK